MTDTGAAYDVEEQRIRINRSIAETEKFVAEQHKLLAEAYKLDRDARSIAETEKLVAEQHKLLAEAHKLDRDARFAPVILIASTMTAGAALFGAGAAFFKLFGR